MKDKLKGIVLGIVIGGMVGFFVCALLSVNNAEKRSRRATSESKEKGEQNAAK